MNKHQLKGSWNEIKGKVKQKWADLTNDDLNKIDGKVDELSGTLQRKYGYTKKKADQEIDDFLNSIDKKS